MEADMSAYWELRIRTGSRSVEDMLREMGATRHVDWEVGEIIRESGVTQIDAGEYSFAALFGYEFDDGWRRTGDITSQARRLSYHHPRVEHAILLGLQPQALLPAHMSVVFHPPVTVRSVSSDALRPRMIAFGESSGSRCYASAPRSDASGEWYPDRAFVFLNPR